MHRHANRPSHADALTGDDGSMSASFRNLYATDALVPRDDAALPRLDRLGRRWAREVQDAGRVWRLLTPDDLVRIEFRQRTLSEMVRLRYALTPAEVDQQIVDFILDHQTSSL